MSTTLIISTAIEATRLLMQSMEAANAGDDAKALLYLEAVKDRVKDAETAWELSKNG